MTAADAWRDQVEADAVACGWPRALARALARHVGKGTPKMPARPKAKAPGPTLEHAAALCGLPASTAADLRAAGVVTTQAAAPLLKRYLAQSARRSPAAAAAALQLSLLNRRVFGTKAPA